MVLLILLLLWLASLVLFPWALLFANGGSPILGFLAVTSVLLFFFSGAVLPDVLILRQLDLFFYVGLMGIAAIHVKQLLLDSNTQSTSSTASPEDAVRDLDLEGEHQQDQREASIEPTPTETAATPESHSKPSTFDSDSVANSCNESEAGAEHTASPVGFNPTDSFQDTSRTNRTDESTLTPNETINYFAFQQRTNSEKTRKAKERTVAEEQSSTSLSESSHTTNPPNSSSSTSQETDLGHDPVDDPPNNRSRRAVIGVALAATASLPFLYTQRDGIASYLGSTPLGGYISGAGGPPSATNNSSTDDSSAADEDAAEDIFDKSSDSDGSETDSSYFEVSGLETNSPIGPNEQLRVEATIENTGAQRGESPVALIIGHDPQIEDIERVALGANESDNLTLEFTAGEPGGGYEEFPIIVETEYDERSVEVVVAE